MGGGRLGIGAFRAKGLAHVVSDFLDKVLVLKLVGGYWILADKMGRTMNLCVDC